MNERKKNLPKRLLSMTLALSMCAGLSCTTAFATDLDAVKDSVNSGDSSNVYVYVNVTDTTTEHAKGDMPKFDAGKTGTELEQSKKDVGDAKTAVENAKPNVTDVTQKEADLNSTEEAVKGALDGLKDADKPSYDGPTYTPPEDTGTTESDPVDSNNTSTVPVETQEPQNTPDTTDTKEEPVNSEFTSEVNGAVKDLNDAQTEMKDKVDNAQKGLSAAEIAVQQATEALKTVIEQAKLTETQKDATDKINAANALIDRYEEDRTKLDSDLQGRIDDLNESKPSETAPVQQEGQSYADYEAAYNAWKDACTAYNDSLNGIKADYEAAAQKLVSAIEAATKAATDAIGDAEKALDSINTSKDKADLGTATDTLNEYVDALDKYSENVDTYQEKVDSYNKVVTGENGYNSKVDAYNQAAKYYNDSVDTYDAKVTEYNKAVTEYQKKADAYNGKVTEYNGKAETWNSDIIKNDESDLTSFAGKDSSVDVDDLRAALETIGKVNDIIVEMKNDTAQTVNPVSQLPKEKIKEYNDAVAVYNAAVEEYNAKNTIDYKLTEINKYFTSQDSYTTESNKNQRWYTVGKISIGNVFAQSPKGILKNVLTSYGNDVDYGFEKTDRNTVNKDDGHSAAAGRDIFYFDWEVNEKTGKKELQVNDPDNRKSDKGDQDLFKEDQDRNTLKNALNVTGDNSKNFTRPAGATGQINTNADFDPYQDVNKWVLKVSYGAADYSDTTQNTETLHLDGYVYVRQLSELALLQEWEDTSAYQEMTDWWGNGVTKDDVKKAGAATLNTANGYQGVTIIPVENVDIPTLSFPWMSVFASKDPATVPNGIEITDPTPEPATPPSGGNNGGNNGGGNNGGGDNNPPANIPDEDPPLVDVPEEDPPLVDIPEEEPPLVDAPEEDPVLDIPEEEPPLVAPPTTVVITETKTPLAKAPAGVDIVDEAVPLADVPKTGDNTALWIAMALASAGTLAVLAPRKKENG